MQTADYRCFKLYISCYFHYRVLAINKANHSEKFPWESVGKKAKQVTVNLTLSMMCEPRTTYSSSTGRKISKKMVSYQINIDAWHSCDGVILLVSLRRADAHQSGILMSDMPHMPKLCSNVCLLQCDSYSLWHLVLYFEFQSCNLFISFMLHTCFWRTVVSGGL